MLTEQQDRRRKYIRREFGDLVGKTIDNVRPLTKAEAEAMAWDWDHEDIGMVIIFTDETILIPMCDEEGNGAGFLFKMNPETEED